MTLTYYYSQEKRNSYWGEEKTYKYDLDKLIKKHIHFSREDIKNYDNGWISGKVAPFTYITLIDVDYEDRKNLTCQTLIAMNISYQVIESTAGRYWIIADWIGYQKKILKLFTNLHHMDLKYGSFCKQNGIMLRAFIKRASIPTFKESYIAPDLLSPNLAPSKIFTEYVQLFKDYWELPHHKLIQDEMIIQSI